MDHAAIRKQMPALVAGHLPRNIKRLKYRIYDDQPDVSALGLNIDPKPFQGTVIAKTDDAIVIKVARAEFAVIDRKLASSDPEQGAKVDVTPYARHHFDGTRIDAPIEERRQTPDGETYTVQSVILSGPTTKLPLPAPRCPELAALIEQIERLPAPDGFRRIAHLLVDACARDFLCVDPVPEDIIRTPPSIRFNVETAKFAGQVTVLYERGLDRYAVELHRDSERVERFDEVFADSLGEVLERLVDDGHWRCIQVDVIPGKAKSSLH